jgi:hypothetical protein
MSCISFINESKRVAFTLDVGHHDTAAFDPFAVPMFDVAISFSYHVVTPLIACIVIVVQGSHIVCIHNWVTR